MEWPNRRLDGSTKTLDEILRERHYYSNGRTPYELDILELGLSVANTLYRTWMRGDRRVLKTIVNPDFTGESV